ncbi:MAG: hypothetical protein WC401_09785 [Bacteroidales bacterium]|jgi:hypothetical protein
MAFRSAGTPRGPVGSGIDCFIMQDNTVLAYSTDLQIAEDMMLDGVQTLGYYGFRDFISTGYGLDMTMGTFLLRGASIAGAVSLPGWQPDGNSNINSNGLYTFTLLDIHELIVLATILGVQYGGGDLNVAQGSLMTRSTRWKGSRMIPGLQTS